MRSVLQYRQDIAGGIGEPGDIGTGTGGAAAHDALVVLGHLLVRIIGTPLAARASMVASISGTGKLRTVYSAGTWFGLG